MNNLNRKIEQQNRDVTLLLMPVVAVLGKIIQIFFLPEKYFFDSTRMLGMLLKSKNAMTAWEGYETTVDIFRKVDFFHFTSIQQWSITLGIIFTILFIIIVSQVKYMSMSEAIFTLMATGLMNIYAFNLAKEPIQLIYFTFILIIIMLPIDNIYIKIAGCCLVYLWEASTFRSYYIMMAAMSFIFFIIFSRLRRNIKKIVAQKIIFIILLCFLSIFAMIFLGQYIDNDLYIQAIEIKDTVSNEHANTAINNFVPVQGNFGNFMINYVINAVRMCIPLELLIKSPVYAPFVIYQFFILFYVIRALKNIKQSNDKVLLALCTFLAYVFGSIVFEPDFGSWVRHEAASFPIFYILAYEDLAEKDRKLMEGK